MAETADMAPARSTARSANGAAPTRRRATARAKADDLEAQVQQLQNDIRSITHTLGRMGELSVDQVKSTARSKAQQIAQRGQSAVEDAQDEFTQLEKQIKDTIREKPLTAVAGAVALGFVLAVITR
ncbi:MAG TPA: hypothetical protein VG757_07455 [Devosia sp.]|nr:hypothetical protein [Devosia sp.]